MVVELGEERAHDFLAREVRRVQDAVVAVAALEVEVELRLVRGRGGELHAPFHELADGRGTALGQDVDGFLLAEARARFEGVRDMEFKFVCLLGDGRDAALRVVRRPVRLCPLREDDDRKAFFCCMDGGAQARNACAQD